MFHTLPASDTLPHDFQLSIIFLYLCNLFIFMTRIHYLAISLMFGLLCGTVLPVSAQEDWNDIHVCSIAKVPPHANVIPYADEEAIALLKYQESPYYRSLNGLWKFRAAENPSACPKDFFKAGYDVSDWAEITVPGNIE